MAIRRESGALVPKCGIWDWLRLKSGGKPPHSKAGDFSRRQVSVAALD
ncbi:MAG TPA: hypothetical protein VJ255_22640 [Candidatus Acidoferrum sp.]|nr:hypothetical protein [Candidatus Acidoferrum sp.]